MHIEYEYTDSITKKRVIKCFSDPGAKKSSEFLAIGFELSCINDELSDRASHEHPITIQMTPLDSALL